MPNKPIGSVPAFTIGLQDEGGGNYSVKKFPSLTTNPGLTYSSRAALYAATKPANTQAWVNGDSIPAYNGVYESTGSGWVRKSDLPIPFIIAVDAGAGTPNAILATAAYPIGESNLVLLNIYETNTGSPVTVSFDGGGTTLTIKTNTGNDVATGGLVAGMHVLGKQVGATFRIVTDQVSAAIIASAEAAEAAAVAARDAAVAAASEAVAATKFDPLLSIQIHG
ncbi:hypothetical protein CCR97_08330 [Rhodoplanes elegans]|uniref:Uncharacterized protein n=1 Tax=Rhodoplanes elegans TaxID=29408 RepID=A0A327L2T3_9BRAD|nr:hypothetical protein [Rhodoplanes elegans]MBK5958217.1 hypothetical protein [Rhodoplanes elegans]RAI41998.1 hypothetical protein CH338_01470 [Rhodoplanes elegans]